jgi:SpoIID/LytB domain protein
MLDTKGPEYRIGTFENHAINLADGDTFTFTVRGYGHCVGMSQHGAGQLAQAGMTYTDILQTYYTGVTVEPYSFS